MIGRRITNGARITLRGKVMYSSAALRIEEVLGANALGTSAFGTNAWPLVPDAESLAGPRIWNAALRVHRSAIDGRLSAFEVGWRIIREFFREQIDNVAGVGFDEKMAGLRAEFEANKAFIVVGKPYVENTSPATLSQRVREMGEALACLASQRSCTVPMKAA
jgi:hypothetical protein